MNIFGQRSERQEAGFFSLWPVVESVVLFSVYLGVLAFGLLMTGSGFSFSPLLLPIALGVSLIAALRFRVIGVLVVMSMTLVLGLLFFIRDVGMLRAGYLQHPLLFVLGLTFTFGFFSSIAALVTGYQVQTASILTHQQNMLLKIFDALPIGIWLRARSGKTVFLNERWASFSPKTKQEILEGSSIKAPVKLGTLWERAVLEVLDADDGATRYQAINLTDSNGHESSMNLLTLRVFIDQLDDYGSLSLLVDETALRAYEDKIQMSEHSLRLALDNAEMGFWDQHLETGVISCDANWLKILGLDPTVMVNPLEVWKERVHPDDRAWVDEVYSDFFGDGKGVVKVDYRIRKGESEFIWVQDNVGVVERDRDGAVTRIMGTMQDITPRKQIEIDLKHAKEHAEAGNAAKGQFLATISHEIRTPLNAIIGLSSFLAESEDMQADELDLAKTIYGSGKSLLMLVNDILDFSKIESGRLELEVQEYPLRLCFEECVKLFQIRAAETGVSLVLDIDESMDEFAIGDMERLRQIVQNLLSNALKFTHAGQIEVIVTTVDLDELPEARRPAPLEPIGYLDQSGHGYLQVVVKDSGIGIPEEFKERLFEAFSQVDASTTRKYGGTGLGLAICKRLVDAMGGNIWVDSEVGEGATFGFVVRTQLVADSDAPQSSADDRSLRISEQHPCDILVVGEASAVSGLLSACRKLGYSPHYSPDYDLNSGAFMRRKYNIIFIGMADEERASTLCREIDANVRVKKNASILGYVPSDRSVLVERCKLSGFQDVLQAPIQPVALSRVILSILGAHD